MTFLRPLCRQSGKFKQDEDDCIIPTLVVVDDRSGSVSIILPVLCSLDMRRTAQLDPSASTIAVTRADEVAQRAVKVRAHSWEEFDGKISCERQDWLCRTRVGGGRCVLSAWCAGCGPSEDWLCRWNIRGVWWPDSFRRQGDEDCIGKRSTVPVVRRVERSKLLWRDSKTKPDEGAKQARDLILTEKVHFLTGVCSSSVFMAINPVAKQYGIPLISAISGTHKATIDFGHPERLSNPAAHADGRQGTRRIRCQAGVGTIS